MRESGDLSLRLGKRALDRGLITAEQLQVALVQNARDPRPPGPGLRLGEILCEKGYITSTQLDTLLREEKAVSPRASVAPGFENFGKFKLLQEVGRGGMGVVFEAHDRDLDRRVALKLLLVSPNANAKEASLDEERFIREARLSARLKHRHIVSVYEAGVIDSRRYIAQEFVDGVPFSDWRRKGSVTIRQQVSILRDIALALHEAHEAGIIHRDLKPGNVLIDRRNEPHVTDFGLAKFVGQNVAQSFTAEGRVVGTPTYMSPEQVRGSSSIDRRTDVYSLGVMLYEILTGRLPFEGETAMEVMMKAVNTPVKEPSKITTLQMNPLVFTALEAVCLKAMAKQPDDRYLDTKKLADDLVRWLEGSKVRASSPRIRRRVTAAAAAALLLTAGALGVFLHRPAPQALPAVVAPPPKPVRTSVVFEAGRLADGTGIRLRTSEHHECRIELIEDRAAAKPVRGGQPGFLLLDVDDAWAEGTVMAEILIDYFDAGPAGSNFVVEYDSMDGRWAHEGAYKRAGMIILEGSRKWRSEKLLVTSPRLENRMELGADLRIAPDRCDILVSRIELRRWTPPVAFAGAPAAPDSRTLKPGLLAEYHAGIHLSDLRKTGVDANVYFEWQGPAWTGGPADEFSIRWTGAFRAPRKGRYLVEVQSDDGAKLIIGGREVISNWTMHPPATDAAMCELDPGVYPLKVEYFEAGGAATLRVAWFEERSGRMWPVDPPTYVHSDK